MATFFGQSVQLLASQFFSPIHSSFLHPGSVFVGDTYIVVCCLYLWIIFVLTPLFPRNSFLNMVFVCSGCITKHRLGAKATEIYCPTVLEPRCSRSKMSAELVLSDGSEGGLFPQLSSSFWRFPGKLWHTLASAVSFWSLPSSSYNVLPLCLISNFPLVRDTRHTGLRAHPTPVGFQPHLANYFYNDCISK